MLEVCFDTNLGGMLTIERYNPELGEPGRNVVTMELFLDVGDLTNGVFSEKRKTAAANLFKDPWMNKRSFIDKRHWDATLKTLKMICDRAKNGEHIRIWYGNDADSYSSFLWLVSELRHFDCKITAVSFNDMAYELEPYGCNWTQIGQKGLSLFTQAERTITFNQRFNIAKRWEDICTQPHPLRIVLNGHVVPVNEGYYDRIILEHLPDELFSAQGIMKAILQNVHTDIPYYYVHRRMCDLFRKHCEIIGERESNHGYLLDRLIFKKI